MGRTLYVNDDIEEAYLVATDGDLQESKELMKETLDEHAPEPDGGESDG